MAGLDKTTTGLNRYNWQMLQNQEGLGLSPLPQLHAGHIVCR